LAEVVNWAGPPVVYSDAMFNAAFLFASLIWGSVGFGYFIYGKKSGSWVPMVGGIVMIAVSYVAPSPLIMTLISVGVIGAVYWLLREGY
jgi:hypothetical protein